MSGATFIAVQEALCALRGLRQGLFYGTKIRLPHASVMTLIFNRHRALRDNLLFIAKATWEHSRNLGSFVVVYKALLAVGRLLHPDEWAQRVRGTPARQWHSFAAAAVGGYLVWADYSSVNYQIVLYLFSRVCVAFAKVAAKNGYEPCASLDFPTVYPYLATGVWACVLWLFEHHPETLHRSLWASMEFLYHDANKFGGGTKATGALASLTPAGQGRFAQDWLPSPATGAVAAYLLLRGASLWFPPRGSRLPGARKRK